MSDGLSDALGGNYFHGKNEQPNTDELSDKEFVKWLYNRIHNMYGESRNTDFMMRLQSIINKLNG